jgi:predicted PurR-regulated permease PerM
MKELDQATSELQRWLERPLTILGFTMRPELILEYLRSSAGTAISSVSLSDGRRLLGLTNNLLWALVVVVSFFYLLRDGPRILPGLIRYLPPAYQEEASELLTEIDRIWGVFLRVQLLIFAVIGVLVIISTTILIWLFRQGWLPLSPIGLIILLIIVYTAIQQVDNLWLRPQYMGQALKLHPGLVFVSLIAALALTGFMGALLVVPTLASLKVVALFLHRRFVPESAKSDGIESGR